MSTNVRLVSPLERLLFLQGLGQLRPLSRSALVDFAVRLMEREFPRGAVLVDEDQPLDRVFIVVSGRVALDVDGVELVVEPGEGINFTRMMGGFPTGRRAVALVPTVVLEVPEAEVLSMLGSNPSMLENSLSDMAASVRRLNGDLPMTRASGGQGAAGERPSGPIGLVQRLTLLDQSPIWRNGNLDASVTLALGMTEVHYPAGTTLWSTGAPSDFAVGLHYGLVECTASDGRQVEVGVGFTLGMLDSVGGLPRPYRAVTTTDVVALRWEVPLLLAIVDAHPVAGIQLLRRLARRSDELWVAAVHRGDLGLIRPRRQP